MLAGETYAALSPLVADTGMSNEKGLGVLVAKFFRWDGDAVIRTFHAALTEANFHGDAERLRSVFPAAFAGGGG